MIRGARGPRIGETGGRNSGEPMGEADRAIEKAIEALCAGMPEFAVERSEIDGVAHTRFVNAPQTLPGLYAMAESFGDQPFLVNGDERTGFAETIGQARRLAAGLAASCRVGKGQRVAIAARNHPEWVVAYMAVTLSGAVVVPMNAWWQRGELEYALRDCDARVVFADEERAARLAPLAESLSLDVVRIRARENALPGRRYETLLEDTHPPLPAADIDPEDEATIFYTSGSTGRAKGVVSTHRAVLNGIMGWALFTTADKVARGVADQEPEFQPATLLTVPLFHVTGCNAMFLLALAGGAKLVFMHRWEPETALELIQRERITAFNGVPTMSWELLQTAAEKGGYDLSSLESISGGGAARPPEHVRRLAEQFPQARPAVGWGLTETNGLGTVNTGRNYVLKPASAGIPCKPVVELEIRDESGRALQTGETGVIWLKSPSNMSAYLNQPEETAAALVDGWLDTGDVGYLDEDGYLFIVDRAKDIVIRGGENISCLEVEAALYEHPAVAETAVFGLPDERLGEVLVAVVQARPGATVSAEDLREHAAGRLAHFKVPSEIHLREERLPRTATGKIFKRALREAALEAR